MPSIIADDGELLPEIPDPDPSDPRITGFGTAFFAPTGPLYTGQINGRDGFEETRAFLTDVMLSRKHMEQRAGLRKFPRRTFRYSVTCPDQDRSNELVARLFALGTGIVSVPIWRDAAPLLVSILPSTTFTVYCESVAVPDSTVVMLWKDQLTYEQLKTFGSTVYTSGYSMQTLVQGSWKSKVTQVVPMAFARLLEAPEVHTRGELLEVSATFSEEPL